MSDGKTHTTTTHKTATHPHHTPENGVVHELKHAATEEHKIARGARKVDSTIYMTEVLTSGNPKRIEKYFIRKFAYKMFGKFMGKTLNRL